VAITPKTRVRISDTAHQKRLSLEEGTIDATVTAPPRLFAVETPGGLATDLGCRYTLSTETGPQWSIGPIRWGKRQTTLLHVISGWVELADSQNGVVRVPAGAECLIYDGIIAPPIFTDISRQLRHVLDEPLWSDPAKLSPYVVTSRPKDSLTLFYLLPRVTGAAREQVWERLVALVPPPPSVSREAALRLDKKALETYQSHLIPFWAPSLEQQLKNFADPTGLYGISSPPSGKKP
jgi:hypothetical protein